MVMSVTADSILTKLSRNRTVSACWQRTAFPSAALFLLTAAFILTKTGRDAMFFQQNGVDHLPFAYLGIAMLSPLPAGATLWLMRAFGSRQARVIGLVAMAVAQAAIASFVRPGADWGMTLLFVSIPLLYGVLLSLAWLLGSDLLDRSPRHLLGRLYSTMGAASMLGGMTGAAIAKGLAAEFDPPAFFLLGAVGLLLAAAVSMAANRFFPEIEMNRDNDGPSPVHGHESPDYRQLLRHRYLILLAGIGMIGALVGVLIEYQFYRSAAESAGESHSAAGVFADFYFWVNGAAVIVQLFATPLLQRWLGVHGSLLILPAALVGGATLVASTASAAAALGLRVTEGGLKSSVHRSNWEQAYLPLDRSLRASAKLFVDGISARMGEGAGAAMLCLSAADVLPGIHDLGWMSHFLVIASILWLSLTFELRRMRTGHGLLPLEDKEFRKDLPIPEG